MEQRFCVGVEWEHRGPTGASVTDLNTQPSLSIPLRRSAPIAGSRWRRPASRYGAWARPPSLRGPRDAAYVTRHAIPVLAATFILAVLIVVGLGWQALAAVGLLLIAGLVLLRWQRGIYAALVYLPFSGVVTLLLYPWTGALLIKDVAFILPAYVGWAAMARSDGPRPVAQRPQRLFLASLATLVVMVVARMAGPDVQNWSMAMIGAKIWLFYLPLYFLGQHLFDSRAQAASLFRTLIVVAIVPCGLGIVEALLVPIFGYQTLMERVYGANAVNVTQGFVQFEIGTGVIRRIPSTFTFVAQYFGYTLATIAVGYCVWRGDPSAHWRRVGAVITALASIASLLSGARSAFVFVPLLWAMILFLDRALGTLVRHGPMAAGLVMLVLTIMGTEGGALYEHISGRLGDESGAIGVVSGTLYEAGAWGLGTGTNTGPARYALADPDSFVAIENYYAKIIYELGVPGLLAVLGLFVSLFWTGYASHRALADRRLRACTAALLAFVTLIVASSLKGWMIELDPVNVYFWLFAGLIVKLAALGDESSNARPRAAGVPA